VKKPQSNLGLLSFGSFCFKPQDVTWLAIQGKTKRF
jgi:hypothetical protein